MRNKKLSKTKVFAAIISASLSVSQQNINASPYNTSVAIVSNHNTQQQIVPANSATNPQEIESESSIAEPDIPKKEVVEKQVTEKNTSQDVQSQVSGELLLKPSEDDIENPETEENTISVKKSGWIEEDGITRFYDENGTMVTDWHIIDGKKYYFGDDGSLYTDNFLELSENLYYINNDGSLYSTTGWLENGDYFYYVNQDYTLYRKGWLEFENTWYYLASDGKMQTGLLDLGNKKYLLEPSGSMLTGNGLTYYNNHWYYIMQMDLYIRTIGLN